MKEEALKARLKYIATERNIPFNQIWKQLLLERFLARLSLSTHREKFVFKGGLLLANYLDIGRETMDIDLSLQKLKANMKNIKTVMTDICNTHVTDNLSFKWDRVNPLDQPHMHYTGYRVSLKANLGKMRDVVQVDIGLGDIAKPVENTFLPLQYKGSALFNGDIKLLMYPTEFIFAEKLETIISKGEINSRMKDYHDLLLMIRENELLNVKFLHSAIHKTFNHRKTNLKLPITFNPESLHTLQRLWTSHQRGLGDQKEQLNLPEKVNEVINEINAYLDKLSLAPKLEEFGDLIDDAQKEAKKAGLTKDDLENAIKDHRKTNIHQGR